MASSSSRKVIVCGLTAHGIMPTLPTNSQQAIQAMPQLHQQTNSKQPSTSKRQKHQQPKPQQARQARRQLHQQPDELDEDQDQVQELTREQYRRAMGHLIRIEEPEEDIDPMYRRALRNMQMQRN